MKWGTPFAPWRPGTVVASRSCDWTEGEKTSSEQAWAEIVGFVGDTPPSHNRERLATSNRGQPTLRRPNYQGWPLRSGICRDGSGKPPDIRISAATSIPAHPPPQNDTKSHQAEIINHPLATQVLSQE